MSRVFSIQWRQFHWSCFFFKIRAAFFHLRSYWFRPVLLKDHFKEAKDVFTTSSASEDPWSISKSQNQNLSWSPNALLLGPQPKHRFFSSRFASLIFSLLWTLTSLQQAYYLGYEQAGFSLNGFKKLHLSWPLICSLYYSLYHWFSFPPFFPGDLQSQGLVTPLSSV